MISLLQHEKDYTEKRERLSQESAADPITLRDYFLRLYPEVSPAE